jgi:formylglycine-generating enzyme required for sulfatase activity
MKQRLQCYFRWTALLFILFLIGTGCSWLGYELRRTPTPSPEPVIAPTAVPAPSPVPNPGQEAVLYADDFTDPASGWPNALEFDNYYIGYHEPDYYHVQVRVPNDRVVAILPRRSFDDFVAEAEVFVDEENTAPSGDFRYGLVARRSGAQYYGFAISPHTKTWSVLKSSPSGLEILAEGTEDSIQGLEEDADTLRVDAKGSDFTFHINGRPASQVKDADYVSGEVGFIVETFDSPRAHLHYDSLVIREFEVPPTATALPVAPLPPREGMVRIEESLYKVGSSKPDNFHTTSKEIRVAAFWIDEYEVRNAHYKKFLDATDHSQPSNWQGGTFPSGQDNHPVKGVTWDQAYAYCGWANKRLPIEAEWEVAARGPGPEPPLYPWGPDSQAGGAVNQLPLTDTYEVGTMPFNKSSFGVYDMAGNVWEWVGEPYAPVPDGYKVLRGGRHGLLRDMAYRESAEPNDNNFLPFTGFRCAADRVAGE